MLLLGFQGNMQQSNESERHGKCSASKGVLGSAPGLQEMYCSLKQSEKPLEIKTEKNISYHIHIFIRHSL